MGYSFSQPISTPFEALFHPVSSGRPLTFLLYAVVPEDLHPNVGQIDLAVARGWPSQPSRFSYYEYDHNNMHLIDNVDGVISYGTIKRVGSGSWRPGYWVRGGKSSTYTEDGVLHPYFCGRCNGAKCTAGKALRDATAPYCGHSTGGGSDASLVGAQLLQGTRGGGH